MKGSDVIDRDIDKYLLATTKTGEDSVKDYNAEELQKTPVWVVDVGKDVNPDDIFQRINLMGGALLNVQQYLDKLKTASSNWQHKCGSHAKYSFIDNTERFRIPMQRYLQHHFPEHSTKQQLLFDLSHEELMDAVINRILILPINVSYTNEWPAKPTGEFSFSEGWNNAHIDIDNVNSIRYHTDIATAGYSAYVDAVIFHELIHAINYWKELYDQVQYDAFTLGDDYYGDPEEQRAYQGMIEFLSPFISSGKIQQLLKRYTTDTSPERDKWMSALQSGKIRTNYALSTWQHKYSMNDEEYPSLELKQVQNIYQQMLARGTPTDYRYFKQLLEDKNLGDHWLTWFLTKQVEHMGSLAWQHKYAQSEFFTQGNLTMHSHDPEVCPSCGQYGKELQEAYFECQNIMGCPLANSGGSWQPSWEGTYFIIEGQEYNLNSDLLELEQWAAQYKRQAGTPDAQEGEEGVIVNSQHRQNNGKRVRIRSTSEDEYVAESMDPTDTRLYFLKPGNFQRIAQIIQDPPDNQDKREIIKMEKLSYGDREQERKRVLELLAETISQVGLEYKLIYKTLMPSLKEEGIDPHRWTEFIQSRLTQYTNANISNWQYRFGNVENNK